MAVLASVITDLGRGQIYAASADADARGAGRGDDWPTGPMPELAEAMDFGTRAMTGAGFDWAAGGNEIAAKFSNAVGDVFTTNGLAAHVYVPGARGPSPSIACYVKAFNAAILDDELVAVKTRLVDSATMRCTARATAPGIQQVEAPARSLAWFSIDRNPGA